MRIELKRDGMAKIESDQMIRRRTLLPKNRMDRLILAVFAAVLVLAFIPKGGSPNGIHSMQQLMDVGHMALFFLACHLLYVYRPKTAEKSFVWQALITIGMAFLAGGLIEILQSVIPNRTPSFGDLAGNASGAVAYLSFRHRKQFGRYIPLHLAAICLIGVIVWPPVLSAIDESAAHQQFPVLAGFEHFFETNRFESKESRFRITGEKAYEGSRSLRLDLSTNRYSGIWMRFMPHDWEDYSFFKFSAYNPENDAVTLHVMINDAHNWSDRYKESFPLKPAGWTPIRIPLAEVKKSPRARELDLSRIRRIGIYVVESPKPITLYIDAIRLED